MFYLYVIIIFLSTVFSGNLNKDSKPLKFEDKIFLSKQMQENKKRIINQKVLQAEKQSSLEREEEFYKNKNNIIQSQYHNAAMQYFKGLKTSLYNDNSNSGNRDRDPIQIFINDSESHVFTKGDSITIKIIFPDSTGSAFFTIGFDENGNNQFDDEIDYIIPQTFDDEFNFEIMDNDDYDENDGIGIFEYSFSTSYAGNSGPDNPWSLIETFLTLSQRFRGFIYVESYYDGSNDYAYIDQLPLETDYSISGTTSPSFPNLFLFGGDYSNGPENAMLSMTDQNGDYTFYYPNDFSDSVVLFVYPIPSTENMAEYFFSPGYYLIEELTGHMEGYDFNIMEADSWAEGYLYDTDGNPAIEFGISSESSQEGVDSEEFRQNHYTDSSGYFIIPLHSDFIFEIGLGNEGVNNGNYITPSYNQDLHIYDPIPGDTLFIEDDFDIYYCDSYIGGHIYLDDELYSGTMDDLIISLQSNVGSKHLSDFEVNNGVYTMTVPDEISNASLYAYGQNNGSNFFLIYNTEYYNVQAEADMLDFHTIEVDGGVEGHLLNSDLSPVNIFSIHLEGESTDYGYVNNSVHNYNSNDGYFKIYMPPGLYNSSIQAENNYGSGEFTAYCNTQGEIEVSESMTMLEDIIIESIPSEDISLSGYINDIQTGQPIENMDINLSINTLESCSNGNNAYVYTWIESDEDGYFEFNDLPTMSYADFNFSSRGGDYRSMHFNIEDVIADSSFNIQMLATPSAFQGACYDSANNHRIDCHIEFNLQDNYLPDSLEHYFDYGAYFYDQNYNYYVNVPNGCYDVFVEDDEWNGNLLTYANLSTTACAENEMVNLDFYLDPFGDIYADGDLNIFDIISIVNMILDGNYDSSADLDEDGFVDIADIIILISWILDD